MTSLRAKRGAIGPLSYRRLKRGGWMALVAICKFALLFAMFRASAPIAETNNFEIIEHSNVETIRVDEGRVCTARSTVTHKLAVRALNRVMGGAAQGGERPTPGSCPRGHRLSNCLPAPLVC